MFLTMASARLPCCTTLSRLSAQGVRQLGYFGERISISLHLPRVSCSSSISSADTPEKLLTKLSGFLISWAMPAVSWPSEASF